MFALVGLVAAFLLIRVAPGGEPSIDEVHG
jgi:hypothetical protein